MRAWFLACGCSRRGALPPAGCRPTPSVELRGLDPAPRSDLPLPERYTARLRVERS